MREEMLPSRVQLQRKQHMPTRGRIRQNPLFFASSRDVYPITHSNRIDNYILNASLNNRGIRADITGSNPNHKLSSISRCSSRSGLLSRSLIRRPDLLCLGILAESPFRRIVISFFVTQPN
jgi:hypothetical protein